MIWQRFVLEKLPVISAYPFLNALLQRFRNRDHFLDFAVGYAAADIVATYISLLPERIERANELRIFSHRQFERLNDAIVMALPGRAISGGRKCRRRALQRRVVGDRESPIVRHVFRLAIFQVARHNSKQVADLLPAALVRDEPAVIDPIGETHVRLLSGRVSFPSLPLKENDSWPRAFRETLVARTRWD